MANEHYGMVRLMRPSKRFLLGLLAFQELSVRSNLLLQPSLDIHEDLIFGVLALHVSSELSQLCLDAANQPLDLRQLCPITRFRVGQGAFQRRFLSGETTDRRGCCQCRLCVGREIQALSSGGWSGSANSEVPC